MLENRAQVKLIQKLKTTFPDCIVIKNDAGYIQGIPDLLVLYKDKWAALECKASGNSRKQPNQEYYVQIMDEMSFSRFVYPENMEEIIHELQQAFSS